MPTGATRRLRRVLNAAGSPPFMTEHRVVVVRDAGALTAGDVDGIVRYLDDPLDTTVLVFVAGGGTMPPALTKKLKEIKAQERAPEQREDRQGPRRRGARAPGSCSPPTLPASSPRTSARTRVGSPRWSTCWRRPRNRGVNLDVDDVRPYLGEAGAVPSYQLTNAIEEGDHRDRARDAAPVAHRVESRSSPSRCTRCR